MVRNGPHEGLPVQKKPAPIQLKLEVEHNEITPGKINNKGAFKNRINSIITDEGRKVGLLPVHIRQGLSKMADPADDTLYAFDTKRSAVTAAIEDVYRTKYNIEPVKKLLIGETAPWAKEEKIKNHVRKLTYPKNGELAIGYFKPSARNETEETIPKKAKEIGVNSIDPKYANREVAASRIGKMIAPESFPATDFAKYQMDGNDFVPGHIQDKAPGDMASGKAVFNGETMALELDPTIGNNAEFRQQLVDLQAFDYLIGNVDRHLENYMIHDKKAIPIDSELSFPNVSSEKLINIEGSTFAGLPSAYSEKITGAVAALNESWIKANLAGVLNADQLAAFRKRLAEMRKDIKAKKDQVRVFEPAASYTKAALV